VGKLKVAALWSGGKDSCLSTYRAISQGFEVSQLISFNYKSDTSDSISDRPLSYLYNRVGRATPNFVSNVVSFVYKDLSRMVPHDVSPEIIVKQAQAMEIPVIMKNVRWDTFEEQLKITMKDLKQKGVEGLVFGVVPPHYPIVNSERLREGKTLMAHKGWINRVCHEVGIQPITPLWESSPEQILVDLVENGFETIIVVVDLKHFNKEWLGRKIDYNFIKDVRAHEKEVHIGGSGYHTLVIDGPLFKKSVKIVKSKKIVKNGYSILDISQVELVKKPKILELN
jgi:uncharacterized protein (TIGR00290 family)